MTDRITVEGRDGAFGAYIARPKALPAPAVEVVSTARARGLKIVFVPHHRWEPGDYVSFDNPSPYQLAGANAQIFAKDSWGGTFHDDFQPQPGDVVVHEHWGSSGFANTDLDLQLKQHGIRRIILIGLIANTCIESTGRFGMELGYHVTLVKDATAAFSKEAMHAAHAINGPTYAHALLTTEELFGCQEGMGVGRSVDGVGGVHRLFAEAAEASA
jgi:nicotinamidase-related amidase